MVLVVSTVTIYKRRGTAIPASRAPGAWRDLEEHCLQNDDSLKKDFGKFEFANMRLP